MSTLLTILMTILMRIGYIVGMDLKLEQSPIELDPEIVSRIRKMSDCTDDEMELIHKNCSSLVHELIHIVYEYEYGSRSDKYGMSKCERAQIACFTHKLWIKSSKCACSICNHIWFYDDEMHQHFVSYFNDHQCQGFMPKEMDKIQFCQFMNQTERSMPLNVCQQNNNNNNSKEINENLQIDYSSNSSNTSNILQTNHTIIIIWTVLLAITMSLSLYFWIH